MSLKARAATPPAGSKQGLPCSIRTLLETLPKDESAALKTMLDAPWRVWPHTEIEKAIEDEGHQVGRGAVGKHRRSTCRCRP